MARTSFNFEQLPVLCLTQIANFLNTLDLVNLLQAVYACDLSSPTQWPNLYLFKLLFNPKELNLENCHRIREDEFKKVYGLFKKLKFDVETINLNFCLSLAGKFSSRPKRLSTLINFSGQSLKSMREFHAIDFELTLEDFESLVRSTQLKALSFGESFMSSLDVKDYELKKNLVDVDSVKICFISDSNLADSLSKSAELFSNVISYEIYAKQTQKLIRIHNWPRPGLLMSRLEDFIIGNDNLTLLINPHLVEFVKNLRGRFRVNLNSTNLAENCKHIQELMSFPACRDLNIVLDIKSSDIYTLDSKYEKHSKSVSLASIDEFIQNAVDRLNTVEKVKCVRILRRTASINWLAYEIKNIDMLRLNEFARLETLDLSMTHVHSTDSICKMIGDFEFLKDLSLPCCALASRSFLEIYKSKSFMHVFDNDDNDEESDESDQEENKRNNVKAELYCLKNLSLSKFTLVGLDKQMSDPKCFIVESNELFEISNWSRLKSLVFQGFKINGSAAIWNEIWESFARHLTFLKHISLKHLINFEMYNYQSVFTNRLKSFSNLRALEIKHVNFFFDQKFLNTFFQMSNSLHSFKLNLKNIDVKLVESNLDAFKTGLENLIYFELVCLKNSIEEIKSLKKTFKQILPETKLNFSNQEQPMSNQDYDTSYLVTISNSRTTHNFTSGNFLLI